MSGPSAPERDTRRFTGFPAGAKATTVPSAFFTQVMPLLTDPAALAVSTYVFYALQRKKGFPRYVSVSELAAETPLMTLLAGLPASERAERQHQPAFRHRRTPESKGGGATEEHRIEAAHALRRGVDAAVELGVLVALPVRGDGRDVEDSTLREELLFLNSPADRRGMELVRRGRGTAGAAPPGGPIRARGPAPSLFQLYEENIGALTPMVADELEEAGRLYPEAWIEAAMKRAAEANARSWNYVRRVLERWAIEGPDYEEAGRVSEPDADRRYLGGKYGRIIRSRLGRD